MASRHLRAPLAFLSLIVIAGCSGTISDASPTAPPQARASLTPAVSPRSERPSVVAPSPTEAQSASAAPSPSIPAATPTGPQTPRGWLEPVTVHDVQATDCGGLTATYGPRADLILVMACNDDIHVTHGSPGEAWVTDVIEHPRGVVLRGPQVAVDGDRLTVAASAYVPEEGGCGDDGLRQTDVLIWSRDLPDGEWTGPVALGGPDGHLQSFRVVDGVIHATVGNTDGVAYVRGRTGSAQRTAIPEASETSLRVGSDGIARIAYTTTSGDLRLVAMRDRALAPETIHRAQDGELGGPIQPSLVLAGQNEPIVLWTLTWGISGCAEPDPPPEFGTYVYADVGGVATNERLSGSTDGASLTLDIPGGRAYVVIPEWVDDDHRTNLYSRPIAGGDWSRVELEGDPFWPIMRVEQATGAAVLAWLDWRDDDSIQLRVMPGQVR